MSILKNAIDSIQTGIEDYKSADDRRGVSAVRNIIAGILLLYKEKLCQLSPENNKELLIKQLIRPVQNTDGDIIFEGYGRKTVDVPSIKERFNSLNIVVDWGRFDEVNNLRNDLEHYYTTKSPNAVKEVVAKSFLLIRDFLHDSLRLDPQETLGESAWSTLLEESEVYSAEEDACRLSIEEIDWKYESVIESLKYLRCNNCHSSLIQAPSSEDVYPNINLKCKSCGEEFCLDDAVEKCIEESLSGEAMVSFMDGGESPYDNCYECNKSTYIYTEGCCVSCGYEIQYTNCTRCHAPLGMDDQYNEGMCGYCQHLWEKMEKE